MVNVGAGGTAEQSEGRLLWSRVAVVLVVGVTGLAHPASAAAHATGPTVALDYRLSLSDATQALVGVRIAIIDGDRALRLQVDPSTALVVKGLLGEPVIRFSSTGVWVNAPRPQRPPTSSSSRTRAPDGPVSGRGTPSLGTITALRPRPDSPRDRAHPGRSRSRSKAEVPRSPERSRVFPGRRSGPGSPLA
jgi:hypothetical protein